MVSNFFKTVLSVAVLFTASDATSFNTRSWEDAAEEASRFVSQLNTTEKIGLVTGSYGLPTLPCVGSIAGIERLNFSGLCYSDGPSGYSRSDGVSVFPSGINAAATWDKRLMYERAVALGEEFRAKGSHVFLGPSPGPMGRSSRAGRNWEGFGPDPYLSGIATNATIFGIQSMGVQTTVKHYVVNEQETQRNPTVYHNTTTIESISENVDDRTLHELYAWPFANAVHANTTSVMCGYNRVNGKYACNDSDILGRILKEELAFPGYVVSDWDATHSTKFANSGLDMEMPGTTSPTGIAWFGDNLLAAVTNTSVSRDRLDHMATRVMTSYFLLGQDENFPTTDPSSGAVFLNYQYGYGSDLSALYPAVEARDVRGDHAKVIREIGSASTVLLKNINGTLPLQNETNIGLFGNDVPYPTTGSVFLGYGDDPSGFEMGTLDIGGGSGTVRHTSFVTPYDAISEKVRSLGGRVQSLFDNNEVADGRFRSIYPKPQACLLFLKAFATEGSDRVSLDLQWNATKAVESTAAMCPNTIVITHGLGVVLMPWADNPNVTAILAAHYPGEESGNAIVDVLWGAVEPSGRLPYSIPRNEAEFGPPIVDTVQDPSDPNAWQADFTEGQMIDYRQFDANGSTPLYAFGYGLSYTSFSMSKDLSVEYAQTSISSLPDHSQGMAPGGLKDLWNIVVTITVEVTNTGNRTGSAVPQLYVSLPQEHTPAGTPLKVLRGFEKVKLLAGETRAVTFELMRRDISFWDVEKREWVIPEGDIKFMAGFDSGELVAMKEVPVVGVEGRLRHRADVFRLRRIRSRQGGFNFIHGREHY